MPKHDLPLAEVMENFHTYNQTCKSHQTCEWYEQRLGVFFRWLHEDLEREPVLDELARWYADVPGSGGVLVLLAGAGIDERKYLREGEVIEELIVG